MVGTSLTLADVICISLQNSWLNIDANKEKYNPVISKYPHLNAYLKHWDNHLEEYLRKRPKSTM